ncbi:MAG: saccharopine dehydrogenase, partial [Calditrichaeota bacterium]|nr:saccharopine dehydrogenase [Calditrichota bacterium]
APGFSNLALGYHNELMKVTDFQCYVGGLPKKRIWPFEYKAPFSPIDVIEEYTRPARLVENGVLVTKPALSESEIIHLSVFGSVEAFNTDGLRSLVKTMSHIPNMKEKTMRYPGHIDIMRILRETGFFSKEKISVNNLEIAPIDLTSQLLFKEWKLGDTEEEFTVMRIHISGEENGQEKSYVYDLHDVYHQASATSSMARTTGYTCSSVARLLLNQQFNEIGVFPPELVGKHANCFKSVLNDLREREITITETVE